MSTLTKYKDKGLSGLVNLGNTCFLNSIMQILSHTYELNTLLSKQTYIDKLNNKPESILIIEWDRLRKALWEKNQLISPVKFVSAVRKTAAYKKMEMFAGFNQNDTSEFLIFVIDCFHTSLSREVDMTINGHSTTNQDSLAVKCFNTIKNMYEKDYSEMWSIFYGIHVSQLQNIETLKMLSTIPEPFFIIDLPIPTNNKLPSLIDCFDTYVKGEILDGDNAVMDESIGSKVSVKKNIMFWSFPSILVIDIKRFNSQNKKNQILIDFPLDNLDLSKYVIGYNSDTYIYDLYGICNHGGSVFGGHYTAFVKNANNKWYHFNDTTVTEVTDKNNIITPKAYCLFYRKRSSVA